MVEIRTSAASAGLSSWENTGASCWIINAFRRCRHPASDDGSYNLVNTASNYCFACSVPPGIGKNVLFTLHFRRILGRDCLPQLYVAPIHQRHRMSEGEGPTAPTEIQMSYISLVSESNFWVQIYQFLSVNNIFFQNISRRQAHGSVTIRRRLLQFIFSRTKKEFAFYLQRQPCRYGVMAV